MTCRTCGTRLTPGAVLCGECGTSAIAPRPTLGDTAHHDRAALLAAIAREGGRGAPPSTTPRAEPSARGTAPATQPPSRSAHAAPVAGAVRHPFSLVFSTGESVRVAGSGLVGRNPTPGPDEHVDYLVQIVDPARSVSKTHLEFAVDGDEFWLRDRGSMNGSRYGVDLLDPVELAAGQWLRIDRGLRVGLGDEWFDLH